MIDKAIAKITEEAMEDGSPFAEFMEEHLTSICVNEAVARKLLDPGKSLKAFVHGITKEYEEKARKRGNGTQAAGAPDRVFHEKAEAYYGVTEADKKAGKAGTIDVLDLL
ncbi:MAG: hypothetical protein HFE75_15055 [Firmicutes bacterium]|jgi:hypothetical protein|nr:hypothetical protein [Bacillota bacterium]